MRQRILARLLHLANSGHPWRRTEFYAIKERLLRRYATFRGHHMQEIRKECWGPRLGWDEYGDPVRGKCGPTCRQCGGTGLFDIRWVRLERWRWGKFEFHIPAGDTRVRPAGHVDIVGRIEHRDYGRLSNEAVLWLYLLAGEWQEFRRVMVCGSCCGRYWWPLTNLQRIAMRLNMKLSWRRCWCGRMFPTWGRGWCVCKRCRTIPKEAPF